MNENKAALGYQNFEEVRTGHFFYIDKTYFIREWWEYADKVTLITCPCRFGKTLNMSTVGCFFRMNMPEETICLKDFPSGKVKWWSFQIDTEFAQTGKAAAPKDADFHFYCFYFKSASYLTEIVPNLSMKKPGSTYKPAQNLAGNEI